MSKLKATVQNLKLKKLLLLSCSFALCILTFTFASSALAQGTGCKDGGLGEDCVINIGKRQQKGNIPGIPAFDNPNASPGNIVSNVIRILYIVGGLAVLLFIVWGAFDWITSGGDKEKVSNARKKITNSLIGLALLSLAAFIVSLFGQIVGIDPTKMGILPTLGEQAPTKP